MNHKMIADRYMVVTSLGDGGMADVYLGIDTILNREVAIKILRGELANDPVTLLRFQREANAASKLTHPNVVEVYDVGESDGRHYIVMEYVRGRTLKQLIAQRGALHKEEAVEIMKQLVSAVQSAHENHIIHRDIKPQNVLVKDDGTVKITDFGIALAHDAVQLTQSDAVLGSAHYLAPETTRGEPATNQIDIYALGIVFYELLSGDVPFHGENPVQIAMKHLREEIPSIKDFNPTLPQSIENIIIKATAKNRSYRYKSAKAMLDDLSKCLLPEYADVDKLEFVQENQDPTRVQEYNREERKNTREVKESRPRDRGQEKEEKSNHRNKTIIGVLLLLIAIGISIAVLYFSGIIKGFSPVHMVEVPDVSGLTQDEAVKKLEKQGFKVNDEVKKTMSHDVAEGQVIKVSPSAGKEVEKGTLVTLTLSDGIYFILDDYSGKTREEVESIFSEAGVNITIIPTEVPTKDAVAGKILKQTMLEKGKEINPKKSYQIGFEIATHPRFNLSDMYGKPVDEVMAALKEQGASVIKSQMSTADLSDEELDEIEKGVVVKSNPEQGSYYVADGSTVITLYYY